MTESWLTIKPQGWRLPVRAGQSLLEAAQLAGIRLARACRNGTCRACLCQLQSGQVRYRIDWPGLSTDERQAGMILPCVAEAAVSDAAPALLVIVAPSAQRTEPVSHPPGTTPPIHGD